MEGTQKTLGEHKREPRGQKERRGVYLSYRESGENRRHCKNQLKTQKLLEEHGKNPLKTLKEP